MFNKEPVDISYNFVKPAREVNRVFLHCSASDNSEHDDVQVIKEWHLQRGFNDVGYHFFITKQGFVQLGRGLEQIPAAQKGHNTGSIAICMHGLKNFTEVQEIRLWQLCMAINRAYGGQISFHGHKEVANKDCPVYDYKNILNLDINGLVKTP